MEPLDEQSDFLPSSWYMNHIDTLSRPFIGDVFERFLSKYEQSSKKNRNKIIKSAVPTMSNLKLYIWQK